MVVQPVGVGPGAGAEAEAAMFVVVAAVAVMLIVKVVAVAMTVWAVTVLSMAPEWVTPASKTLPVTNSPPTNYPATKSSASPPQAMDPGCGQDSTLWRRWRVRIIHFSPTPSNPLNGFDLGSWLIVMAPFLYHHAALNHDAELY